MSPQGTCRIHGDDRAAVRAWAPAQGYAVADRGRIAADVLPAYRERG